MNAEQERSRLRGLVFAHQSEELAAHLSRDEWPPYALQLIGDGLVDALARGVDGAAAVARNCIASLRARGWSGDAELADALDARIGGVTPMLRTLPVDLEELASVLEGDPLQGTGAIDLTTGDVWPRPALDYADETGDFDRDDLDDPDRWLVVHCEGSRAGYQDMEFFITAVEDPDIADRLGIAIEGRGAFRRFKDTIARWPELQQRWYALSDDRQRGRAREWLTERGYTPVLPDRP